MPELRPHDENYDNAPAILERILNEGECILGPEDYYTSSVKIPEGVCGKLGGVSSGYRNTHTGLTCLKPIPGWDGEPLIDWSATTADDKATARGVEIFDIMFLNPEYVDPENKKGVAIHYRAADLWLVSRVNVWGFAVGIKLGEIGQPFKNVLIENSHFIHNLRGIYSVRPAPDTVTSIRIQGNNFIQNGTNDPEHPGGCIIVSGGRNHYIAQNYGEKNSRGIKLHDTKNTLVINNDLESNGTKNIVVSGLSTKSLNIIFNTLDRTGIEIPPELMNEVTLWP